MTKQEKIIVSAYTGVLMCDFGDVHEYVEEKLGRPIFTHEFADKDIQKEIKEKSKEDFLKICSQEEPRKGMWIERAVSREKAIDEWQSARCSVCGLYHTTPYLYYFRDYNYCPNCGARMVTKNEM